jgi:hypothetical protein
MKTLNDQVKLDTKPDSLLTYKNKFYALAYDIALATGEAYFTTGRDLFHSKYRNILLEISNAQTAEDVHAFKRALTTICEEFDTIMLKDFSSADFNRYALQWHQAYSNRQQNDISNSSSLYEISRKIIPTGNRDITLFYPDCYDGANIDPFNIIPNKVLAYGNEANDVMLSRAKSNMHKVVKGILRGSRIQNNAFDILYVQPKLHLEIDEEDIFANKRIEKSYIADMFKYLRTDGVMVITMPYTRLFKDICSMLSKHLKNIQIIKAEGIGFSNLGLVHIIGQKESVKEPREEEYAKLRRLFEFSRIANIEELDTEYVLPRSSVYIDLFKGSALDLEEVEQIIEKSSLMDKMWANQRVEKLDETIKNPLLPFNIGQLGLVLTSGCLDGIVDEGDGHSHLIKGRVSKQTVETETDTDKGVEITETTVNKVEINVLLPNGEFKVLA